MIFFPLLHLLCIFNKLISSIFRAQQLKNVWLVLRLLCAPISPWWTQRCHTVETAPSCKEVECEGELYTCLVAGKFRLCARVDVCVRACVCTPLWTPAVRSVFPPRRGPIWLSRDICCSHLMEPHTETLLTCVCGRTDTCCLMALCGFRDGLHAVCLHQRVFTVGDRRLLRAISA